VAGITDASDKEPLLKTLRLGHGTLECVDIHKTRRFYEQVLGLDVIQTSPTSLMIRKGTNHVYAVAETGHADPEQPFINHNGLDVGTDEEVEQAYELISSIREEWGLKKVNQPRHAHGDHSFFFQDFDGNWWEIVAVRPGGYSVDFEGGEPDRDLTGRHELDKLRGGRTHIHTHDAEFRAWLNREVLNRPIGTGSGSQP
jgi:catechol 2,3-dioxygenase-like lactoylglutathione lyase family enzyme